MQAAIIANPHAGAMRRHPRLAERLRREAQGVAEVFVTDGPEALKRTAEQIADQRVPHVAIVGGDGSASTALTALWHTHGANLPQVTLLRGGTMNTVANSIGVPRGRPLRLLQRALPVWSQRRPAKLRRRSTMLVGNRLGFLFGTGVWYGFMSEYYARGHGHPSALTAARVLSSSVASALVDGPQYHRISPREELEVRFDGGSWERRCYSTVSAGTVADAGLGFRPFYRAEEGGDGFHLLAVKGSPAQLAGDLPSVWLGRGMRPTTAYEAKTCWAELRGGTKGFGYTVDGDLFRTDAELRIETGPVFSILCI